MESSKSENSSDSNAKLNNIKINDIIEAYCENEHQFCKFILKIVQARVLQIKEEEIKKEKTFYVHFLNFEKRMDRWVSEKQINLDASGNNVNGVNLKCKFRHLCHFLNLKKMS
jgi:hypothetical protein